MKVYDPIPDFEPERDFDKAPMPKPRAATIFGVALWVAAVALCVLVVTRVVVVPW
jgi:hypothetical protein